MPPPPNAAATSEDSIEAAFVAQDWGLLVHHCNLALRRNAQSAAAHRRLGFGLARLGDVPAALNAYAQALALYPDDVGLTADLADLLRSSGRNSEARPLLEQLCQAAPGYATWLRLAECCHALGDYGKGRDAARQACALAETAGERLAARSQEILQQNELDRHDPQRTSASQPTRVALAAGQELTLEDAHRQLQAQVEAAKSSEPADQGAAWLRAAELAGAILQAAPGDAVALSCLAEIEHAQGRTEVALAYLHHAQGALMQPSPSDGSGEPAPQPQPTRRRPMPPKFRFVVSTRGTQEDFFANTATGKSLALYPYPDTSLFLNCNNTQGLYNTFNRAIEACRDDPAILIFMHEDIHICDAFWREHIVAALEQFDLVGLAGNRRRVPFQPSWAFVNGQFQWDAPENLSGTVAHGLGWPPKIVTHYGPTRQEVKLVDGLMLIAHSQTLIDHDIRFDTTLDFHFYDLDICRQFEAKGLKIGTWDISVVHESTGGAFGAPDWRAAYQKYIEKWGS